MARPTREVPPPLEGNDRMIAAIGAAAWAVPLIILVIVRGDLPASQRWWIWTCVVGAGLGVFGVLYIPRLKRSRERAAGRQRETARDG